jgi:hypothetical protein
MNTIAGAPGKTVNHKVGGKWNKKLWKELNNAD